MNFFYYHKQLVPCMYHVHFILLKHKVRFGNLIYKLILKDVLYFFTFIYSEYWAMLGFTS